MKRHFPRFTLLVTLVVCPGLSGCASEPGSAAYQQLLPEAARGLRLRAFAIVE